MGKSIRSKIKKKFRTIKRKQIDPFVVEKVRLLHFLLPGLLQKHVKHNSRRVYRRVVPGS
jgi:hypothetical protein